MYKGALMSTVRKLAESVAALIARVSLPNDGCSLLMFHHVAQPDSKRLRVNEHLKVSPDFLQLTISRLKRRGYAFISMDEVLDNLRGDRKMHKAVSLTFDDGYMDNFTVGRQVLGAEDVPGIVYVATGLGSAAAPIWWDAFEEYVLSVDKLRLPDGMEIRCVSPAEKEQAFVQLRSWALSLSPGEIRVEISRLCHKSLEWVDSFGYQMASRATLCNFASDRLLTIGCHTHGHISCGRLSDGEVEADLRMSLEYLSSCGVNARHFAFPYGDEVDDADRFVNIFASVGIETAATTYSGVVKPGRDSRFFMPRIFVSECDGFSERNIQLGQFQSYFRMVQQFLNGCR